MPWSVKDVDSHKKGLTPEQKKKWVDVANGVYRTCIKDGGDDKTCAPKAIRIANSKFSEEGGENRIMLKVPSLSLNVVDSHCFAKVSSSEESAEVSLDMVCYSGKIIEGHWYWGNLVIDLDGMVFPKNKYPILEDHDTEKKVAFIKGKPVVTDEKALTLDPSTVKFLETPYAEEFIKLSKQGFPFEASIRAYPFKIEYLDEGQEADVNGFSMKGPGTIWRKSTFKEVSVVVFGHDDKTSSRAFSAEIDLDVEGDVPDTRMATDDTDKEFTRSGKGEKKKMTLEELKQQHPDLIVELSKEIEMKFSQEKESLVGDFTTQLKSTNDRLTELSEKNLTLEKMLSIREEKDRQQVASSIFSGKLTESKIPETLHDKVMKQIEYTKFVKESVLDVEAFTKAVDEEIKDWEGRIGDKVLGFGIASKEQTKTDDTDSLSKDDDEWVKKMLTMTGQQK